MEGIQLSSLPLSDSDINKVAHYHGGGGKDYTKAVMSSLSVSTSSEV